MKFESDDNNILMQTLMYLKMQMAFCLCICCGSIVMIPIIDDLYLKGVYTGFAILSMILLLGTLSFIASLVPKEDFDEMYRQLEEELERRKEELKRRRREELKTKKNIHKTIKIINLM